MPPVQEHASRVVFGGDSRERDASVNLPVVGKRVHVVVGGDTLGVAQQLGDFGE
jgi:hypothetical protein